MNTKYLRISIDIFMTCFSIILMGGAYFFPQDLVHEILGAVLFVIWAVHIFLNHRWYSALFKGRYSPRRIMQTLINCGIFICVIFLVISGIILSNHIFTFLGIESGLGFARTAHLLSSHWYFLFMSLHIGLHSGMIANKIQFSPESKLPVVLKFMVIIIALYGIYAFVSRGVWKYLILTQKFFFFNFEKGYLLFFVDYISIIVLFAFLSNLIQQRLQKNPGKC